MNRLRNALGIPRLWHGTIDPSISVDLNRFKVFSGFHDKNDQYHSDGIRISRNVLYHLERGNLVFVCIQMDDHITRMVKVKVKEKRNKTKDYDDGNDSNIYYVGIITMKNSKSATNKDDAIREEDVVEFSPQHVVKIPMMEPSNSNLIYILDPDDDGYFYVKSML